jgi:hypothetical protein
MDHASNPRPQCLPRLRCPLLEPSQGVELRLQEQAPAEARERPNLRSPRRYRVARPESGYL